MKSLILDVSYVIGLLCAVVVACDALPRAWAALRRRRRAHGGAFGVVVDRAGTVLGTYLDPFGHPWRAARVHEGDSPWVTRGPDGRGWAWEGFGRTEEEALGAANRLRRRHLQLLGLLDPDEDEDFLALPGPYAPPGD